MTEIDVDEAAKELAALQGSSELSPGVRKTLASPQERGAS